jgi:hypothetical protein
MMATECLSSDVVRGSEKFKSKETIEHITRLRSPTLTQGQGRLTTRVGTHFKLLVLTLAIVPLLIVTVHIHHAVVMDDPDPTTCRAMGSPA